ncbi:Alpha-tocopherol transfer protein [Apis cerana cerana]|uniref:Alpha-tocopherol transfer protein n=1 Tax=Apis cerana cerana TaxID=94128 RepID=A0A2A3EM32_APICC|nr:Alpha-tocopherol transfer protein [Apis cerana cerana]
MSFDLDLKLPGPEALAVAEKELRETEENVKDALAKLRTYLEEDKTLHFGMDDEFLIIFLRPCKFYAKSAYELMRRVAEFKEKNSSILKNLMPNDEEELITKHNVVNVIKERDHKGRRILVVQCGKNWNTSAVNSDQIFRLFYLIHELAMLEPETQIHIVKQSLLFNMVWQMIKPFVREKMKNRIFFHGNKMSSFHNYIPASYLPENYGGELPKINYTSADWYPVLLKSKPVLPGEHRQKMEQEGKQDADRVDSGWKDASYVKIGNYTLKLDFDEGDEYFWEKARDELRETPEIVEQSLNDFRTMVKGNERDKVWGRGNGGVSIPLPASNDAMKKFYKFKLNNPRFCLDLVPSNEQKVLRSDIAIPLPDRTADGCRMILINAGKQWNPKIISGDEILRTTMLLIEMAIFEPKTQICGIHAIINMAGFSLSHATHITPSFAAAMTEWIQRCLPSRIKGIHIVNQPFIFKMVYAIFKPFLLVLFHTILSVS